MTTTAPTFASETYPHYAAAYAAQQPSDIPALRKVREQGWEAFNRLGPPTRPARQTSRGSTLTPAPLPGKISRILAFPCALKT